MFKADPRFSFIGNRLLVGDIVCQISYLVCSLPSADIENFAIARPVDVPLQFPFIFGLFHPIELGVSH